MNILTGNQISNAIKKCAPYQIAVAYIGEDWSKYIKDIRSLEFIIISPTFGTNPKAVTEIATEIGWEKILFIDELHAKIYLGNNSAVIGSANLTFNGLSGLSLIEMCIETTDKAQINSTKLFIAKLKLIADKQYPTTARKKEQISKLEEIWGKAISSAIVKVNRPKQTNFMEFDLLEKDQFYVAWYQRGDCSHSDDMKFVEDLIEYEMHFASTDRVNKNKWILCWQMTDKEKPHKKARVSWLYIHEVFKNGIVDGDDDYPQCAIQRNDYDVPVPPFELTPEVEAAFKKSIIEPNISRHLIQNGKIYNLSNSFNGVPILVNRMKDIISGKHST